MLTIVEWVEQEGRRGHIKVGAEISRKGEGHPGRKEMQKRWVAREENSCSESEESSGGGRGEQREDDSNNM